MYITGCVFVFVGYLPDIILRSAPWDETLLEGSKPLMIILAQFLLPLVFSVAIPLIAIYSDRRVRRGVVEGVKTLRCALGCYGYYCPE